MSIRTLSRQLTALGLVTAMAFTLACTRNQASQSQDPTAEENPTAPAPTAGGPSADSLLGGADPSGGEGQRSEPAQLKAAVEDSLTKLPWLFLRMNAFLQSPDAIDQNRVKDISFLKPCFEQKGQACPFIITAIQKVKTNFRAEPNYVPRDCPAVENHTLTDMSLTKDQKLCVSFQLNRYPEKEMQRQVLALLAHEVAHANGFTEAQAQSLQYWTLENPGVTFPSALLPAYLDKRLSRFSMHWAVTARLLGIDLVPDRMRVCEYFVQLNSDFEDLAFLFEGDEQQSMITVPENPIRITSSRIQNRMVGLVIDYCINKFSVKSDPLKPLNEMLEISKMLDYLQGRFSNYTAGVIKGQIMTSLPKPSAMLTLLIGIHDKKFPGDTAEKIVCQVSGTGESIDLGRGRDLAKETYLPYHFLFSPEEKENLPALKIAISNLGSSKSPPQGSVGLSFEFTTQEEPRYGIPPGYRVKILGDEADQIRQDAPSALAPVVFKVFGKEQKFNLRFRVQKNYENLGPEVTVTCADQPAPPPSVH